jgi:Zn-dependent membrane protease YugP
LDAILWLEDWLKAYEGTLILISHDRDFLDAITDHILHIENQELTLYTGNYSTFETTRSERLAQQQQAFEKQQETRAHLQKFIDRFKAKATKARQAQSRIKQLERMQQLAPAHVDTPFTFSFCEPTKMSSPLLTLDNASIGYGDKQIAEKMLRDNGIYDVQVVSTPGFLSDHYNPENKTVNLSPEVYDGESVTASAVAAHECGHAIQHATQYSMLQMRSKMVPAVKIGSTLSQWVILAGIGMMGFGGGNQTILLIGILLFSITTIFSIVTLPVEYDASNRALAWLEDSQILQADEHKMAEDALKWAARTYVVAAISSIATLLYYILIFMNRSSDDRN